MILIIGATGTNGNEIVKQLTSKGYQVKAMVRNLEKAASLKELGASLVQGDLDQPSTLKTALEGIDKVFLVSSVNQQYEQQVANFLEAAKNSNVKYLVKLSGFGADVNASSVIAQMHGRTDELVIKSGLDYTILRPNSFYQNMLWSAYTIKNFGSFSMPLGEAKQSFIDVRDIGAVATLLLTTDSNEHKGKIYELTGPQSLSFTDIAKQLSQTLGKEITYNSITIEESKAGMLKFGMPEWNASTVAELYETFATGKYSYTTDTVSKILGRAPISFQQFTQDYLSAFQA